LETDIYAQIIGQMNWFFISLYPIDANFGKIN